MNQKNFKGQLDDEVVLCYFRKHWIALFPRLMVLPVAFLFIVLGFVFLRPLSQSGLLVGTLTVGGFLALAYIIHAQFLAIFHYYLHTIIITNHRIVEVDRSVFLKDAKNSIDLSNIQDVQKNRSGLMQSIFDYGSLVIVLSGSSETRTLDLVPRPEYQFKKINQVKSTYLPTRNQQIAPTHFAPTDVPFVRDSVERSLSLVE